MTEEEFWRVTFDAVKRIVEEDRQRAVDSLQLSNGTLQVKFTDFALEKWGEEAMKNYAMGLMGNKNE